MEIQDNNVSLNLQVNIMYAINGVIVEALEEAMLKVLTIKMLMDQAK